MEIDFPIVKWGDWTWERSHAIKETENVLKIHRGNSSRGRERVKNIIALAITDDLNGKYLHESIRRNQKEKIRKKRKKTSHSIYLCEWEWFLVVFRIWISGLKVDYKTSRILQGVETPLIQ